MAELRIFDKSGAEQSPEWLAVNFGDLAFRRAPSGPGWRLVELREREGPAVLIATLRKDGAPANGVKVARAWGSDIVNGIIDPELPDLPVELATWFDRGVWGPTEGGGAIGFGFGGGDRYTVSENGRGASAIWCQDPSDVVLGLGWVFTYPDGSFTPHRCLESVFEWGESDNGGEDGDWYERAAEALEQIGEGWIALGSVVRELGE